MNEHCKQCGTYVGWVVYASISRVVFACVCVCVGGGGEQRWECWRWDC